MQSRAQTAVEYILLVGAVIFLVVILFLVVKDRIVNPSGHAIDTNTNAIASIYANVTR
ncbi:MAG: hypothetical protein V1708_06600 [Candidatus Micrarchaeota archaeon]